MTKLDISINELIVSVVTAVAIIFCIVFFNGANADSMTSDKYQMPKKNPITQSGTEKARCDSLVGSEKGLCVAKSEGAKSISKAELLVSITPTTENLYDANLVKADVAFVIANKQCYRMKDAEQDACENVAKLSHEREIASAKAQRDMKKSGAIKKDKTAKFNGYHYKDNPFITVEFDNIYHVKA